MAKWIVRVPFEGTGYIPIETDASPGTPEFKSLVENRIQIGNVHVNKPSVFKRDQIQAEEADDEEYARLDKAIRDTNRREGVNVIKLSSALDKIADALESKGYLKEAAEIDAISNAIDSNEAPKDETQSKIDRLKQPQTIIQALKNIARKVPAAIIDELLDAFERDSRAQGMREATADESSKE